MELTTARIQANQTNAKKSTGPKTPEGKERSRVNALKHGFCAEVVALEDPDAIRARAGEFDSSLPPDDRFGAWLAGQVAVLSLRIERCQESERAVRGRVVARAEVTWEEDRRLEVALLGATLAARPEVVSVRLLETYHGCEWLICRWALLAHAADAQQGVWTSEQEELAFNLMGTPRSFRQGCRPGTVMDTQGLITAEADRPAEVARAQAKALLERKASLEPLDLAAQERAEAGLADDADPELRRLRRYEATLQRRLEWSLNLLQTPLAPTATHSPENGSSESAAPPSARVEATPPEIRTGESGSARPNRASTRAEQKLRKAEVRREARKRKLDQILR